MKKNVILILLALFFAFTKNVQAVSLRNIIRREVKPTIAAIRRETRERLNQKKEIQAQIRGLLGEIKNQIKERLQNLRFSARITGKITEKGESYIKVEVKDGKIYQVNITEKTQFRRRFWGKSNLNEFSVGDEVNVIGKYANDGKTIIDAILIRNLSIQRRWGVFFGKVTAKRNDSFVIESIERGNQTVYFDNAKFVNRRGEAISYDDIQIGHRVRVKGVWDRSLSKIIDVEEVKDFSLPPMKSSVSSTP